MIQRTKHIYYNRKGEIMLKKYSVYFINVDGFREGTEAIEAGSPEEAVRIYRRYFNVKDECKAIPIYEPENR
jgi:hypothetical protein